MKAIEKYNKVILLIELFVIFTVITLGIKYYFKPFIIIIIMMIIGRTFYDFFLKFNVPNRVSGALSILLINVILFCFVFYFGNEFIDILKKIYNNHAEKFIILEKNIKLLFGIDIEKMLQKILKNITSNILTAGASITGEGLIAYIIGNITVYFLLTDRKKVIELVSKIVPSDILYNITEKKNNLKQVIKIELALVCVTTTIIIIGFIILHIPSGFFLGILCGILDILPYVGTIIVFIPIIIYNIVVKKYLIVIGMISLYILSQIIREILELKFLSSKLEIHPLAIMLSIYIGAEIFGIIGILVGPIYCLVAKDILYD
ncbi:MAG: AI-2E family transporter [Clostridium sp.]|nr:AI-2E family transporter [Clostridium sp.]